MTMTQAQLGNIVQVYYTGRLEDGTIFDAASQEAPVELTLGVSHTISGFEQAVVGMRVGEHKTVFIPAEQAYGMHRPEMVLTMPLQNLPGHIQSEVRQQLQIQREGEPAIGVIVVGVTDIHVLLDANHPLAGRDLTFDLSLAAVVGGPQDE
jgi:peptidylprolyl isomerase